MAARWRRRGAARRIRIAAAAAGVMVFLGVSVCLIRGTCGRKWRGEWKLQDRGKQDLATRLGIGQGYAER